MNKPKIEYDSQGPIGNIYHLLGLCSQALKKQKRITDFNNLRDKVYNSKSYDDALDCIKEYVELIDTSKE